ncbi:MAG: ABC transporter substrate-binding protein [Alphaproteobacteria bacterium]|nr:ABC transporter substrate-binding protein [Alphaproteobacteria bacterium]
MRVLFLFLLAFVLLVFDQTANACIIMSVTHRADTPAELGFFEELRANGIECTVEKHNIDGKSDRLPEIAAQARTLRPDLIFSMTTVVTKGLAGRHDAEDGIHDIPIVFALVSDPEGAGLVAERQDPDAPLLSGRNLTGARHVVSHAVRFDAMRRFGRLNRLAILFDGSSPAQLAMVDAMRALANQAGVELLLETPLDEAGKPSVNRIPEMMDRVAAWGPDQVYLPPSNFFARHAGLITDAITDRGLASFCGLETYMERSCLVGLVAPLRAVGRLAGRKAVAILRDGADPGEVPIETLPRFSLIVNMPVARRLGKYPSLQMLHYAHVRE